VNRPIKIQLKQKLKLRVALPPFEGGTAFLQPYVQQNLNLVKIY